MSYQRSKAPLALMEQIIMIFVFALAAAVCLQAFVYSDNLSKQGEMRDAAVIKVQKMAEYCKAGNGDFEKIREAFPAEKNENGWVVRYPEEKLTMNVEIIYADEYMEKAVISVTDDRGDEVYSIPAAWQRRGQDGK